MWDNLVEFISGMNDSGLFCIFFSLLNLESLDLFGLNIENHTVLASLWTKDPFINNFTKFNWSILRKWAKKTPTMTHWRSQTYGLSETSRVTVRFVPFLIHLKFVEEFSTFESLEMKFLIHFNQKIWFKPIPAANFNSCVVFNNYQQTYLLLRIGSWWFKMLLSYSQTLLFWEIIMGCGSK